MSTVYRQTLNDELAAKVDNKRKELGLTIQEITTIALALFCQAERVIVTTPAEETQREQPRAYELEF